MPLLKKRRNKSSHNKRIMKATLIIMSSHLKIQTFKYNYLMRTMINKSMSSSPIIPQNSKMNLRNTERNFKIPNKQTRKNVF